MILYVHYLPLIICVCEILRLYFEISREPLKNIKKPYLYTNYSCLICGTGTERLVAHFWESRSKLIYPPRYRFSSKQNWATWIEDYSTFLSLLDSVLVSNKCWAVEIVWMPKPLFIIVYFYLYCCHSIWLVFVCFCCTAWTAFGAPFEAHTFGCNLWAHPWWYLLDGGWQQD